jgi:hypothetical protein
MASGLGGILAYGLMQMDGISGRTGWEWIFIVSFRPLAANDFYFLRFILNHEERDPFPSRENYQIHPH